MPYGVAMADSSVRGATPSDASAIAPLLIAYWLMGPSAQVTQQVAALDPEELADSWRGAIAAPLSPKHLTLVACDGQTVVGFLASTPIADSADTEIVELVVASGHRRQGHGSRLLMAWADLAHESGATGGTVWITDSDALARAFYEPAGWSPDGISRTLDLLGDGQAVLRQDRLVTALEGRA